MVDFMLKYEGWFVTAGRFKSTIVGVAVGSLFIPFALVGYGLAGFVLSFFVYFPLHFWLTISLFLVLFSSYERERLLGGSYSAFGGFFARMFSPFGLFCLGWFYALLGLGFVTGTVD
ncbi:hypothetical protein [Tabrizicola sp.]|uniref:hypothetical protein n=1 Tax=Tabrizicola sp. TaxID=2005166 RepID=UPI003F2FACF2